MEQQIWIAKVRQKKSARRKLVFFRCSNRRRETVWRELFGFGKAISEDEQKINRKGSHGKILGDHSNNLRATKRANRTSAEEEERI